MYHSVSGFVGHVKTLVHLGRVEVRLSSRPVRRPIVIIHRRLNGNLRSVVMEKVHLPVDTRNVNPFTINVLG